MLAIKAILVSDVNNCDYATFNWLKYTKLMKLKFNRVNNFD